MEKTQNNLYSFLSFFKLLKPALFSLVQTGRTEGIAPFDKIQANSNKKKLKHYCMDTKIKYLIFFIGLIMVGAIVYIALWLQSFWVYIFTLIPIMVIVRVMDDKKQKKQFIRLCVCRVFFCFILDKKMQICYAFLQYFIFVFIDLEK